MTQPNEDEIEIALWNRMHDLAPVWTTKLPGVTFVPTGGPYQRGTWMPGDAAPVAFGYGAYHRQRGIYQIDLNFPKSEREVDTLVKRGKAMRLQFYPANGRSLAITAGEGQLIIDRRPTVSKIDEDTDPAYNRVIVSVPVRIELPPAA